MKKVDGRGKHKGSSRAAWMKTRAAQVLVVSVAAGWVQIAWSQTGDSWAAGGSLSSPDTTVIYTQPTPHAPVEARLAPGLQIHLVQSVTNNTGTWWFVQGGGQAGWIMEPGAQAAVPPPVQAPAYATQVAPQPCVPCATPAPGYAPAAGPATAGAAPVAPYDAYAANSPAAAPAATAAVEPQRTIAPVQDGRRGTLGLFYALNTITNEAGGELNNSGLGALLRSDFKYFGVEGVWTDLQDEDTSDLGLAQYRIGLFGQALLGPVHLQIGGHFQGKDATTGSAFTNETYRGLYGFGVDTRIGLLLLDRRLEFYGDTGYTTYTGDRIADADGFELIGGVRYAPANGFGGFVEYRYEGLEYSHGGTEDWSDIRAGVTFAFSS